jgi:integrase
MPLKLIPPRQNKSPNWSIRGTYLGCYCDRSTGTGSQALAKKLLKELKGEIERGAVTKKENRLGFAAAATAYMRAGGQPRFLAPLIEHFGNTPLEEIDQIAIDNAAGVLYPNVKAATHNRQVYVPTIAVLHRAGIQRMFKRPKGWQSPKRISWLRPEQAFALFAAADTLSLEFGLFLRLLCYTGMRLNEAEQITIANVHLGAADLYIPKTKNKDPRNVHLTPELVAALANHPRGLDRPEHERLFRYSRSYLRDMLAVAMPKAGLGFPTGQNGFHLFRHTWAMWMRKFAGLDTSGLVETGAWKDRASASRYEHLDATEEAQKANLLPTARTV